MLQTMQLIRHTNALLLPITIIVPAIIAFMCYKYSDETTDAKKKKREREGERERERERESERANKQQRIARSAVNHAAYDLTD